jgi:putative colanic acid biosynthesis glycosyltransferase
MDDQPVFSIVTVCKDALHDIQVTFASIASQTCRDWEWIVIDGGSVDDTPAYLDSVAKEHGRIKWVSEPDNGLYDAMNKGIAKSQGRYLLFLNAADTFAADTILESVTAACFPGNPDFIYGDAKELSSDHQLFLKKARSVNWLWYGMFTHHQAMFFHRGTVGTMRYRTEYAIGADYGFVVEFLLRAKSSRQLPLPICVFKQGGLSSIHYKHGWRDQWHVRKTFLGYSLVRNGLIRCLQMGPMTLRRMSPKIYSWLRFGGPT